MEGVKRRRKCVKGRHIKCAKGRSKGVNGKGEELKNDGNALKCDGVS